ncbi:helix-turn-helix domain-containing protein [Alkalicoccobacillus plakortidis]|uniref:Helix-turn-helix domain-containing protein n=1 Tax=Alkalicoccobacillus plakortidis TaxID=444060 RepID=A0ABT0XNG3_9BACI|nr:helix-turn-helix domain-containing protein [Alkalicoccobacillus plakortidis]MCM2677448.1 helix-turn-helix domain-containing protein [Alkalicoccobacillus plakortidis]
MVLDVHIQMIKDKCELICNTFDIAAFFVTPDSKVLKVLSKKSLNPLYDNEKKRATNILKFDASQIYTTPIIRKTAYFEKFIIVSVMVEDSFIGNVIIGPVTTSFVSKENVSGLIKDEQTFANREEVYRYYQLIPNITLDKLINMSVLINNLINGSFISPQLILGNNKEVITPINDHAPLFIDEEASPSAPPFRDRLFEKEILSIVEGGRVDALDNPFFLKEEGSASVYSEAGYLRSLKTHMITLITLVTRSSINGGLNPEEAFRLNDNYIKKLETLHHVDDVKRMSKEMLYTFTNKVKQVNHEHYSKTVSKSVDYVIRHLYSDIAHDDIANYVDLSPKYLSVLFKKEVGMSLTDYIRFKRIEEAKRLLENTQATIPEICAYLSFYDQSYFTKVFKKLVGMTPRQYREKQHLT